MKERTQVDSQRNDRAAAAPVHNPDCPLCKWTRSAHTTAAADSARIARQIEQGTLDLDARIAL